MIDLILKIVPWLAMAGGIVFGLFRHKQAQTASAQAEQKVAEANRQIADTNAAAAQKGAEAAKERVNVENDIASRPAGDAAKQLRDRWSAD